MGQAIERVIELLQPFLDQLVRVAAQPPADHVLVAADLDEGEDPLVVRREIDLDGKVPLADLRLQGSTPAAVRV